MNGTVYLVGIGPGSQDYITPRAVSTLKNVLVIIGHQACLDLIADFTAGKEIISADLTPVQRAEIAVAQAFAGKDVAIVSTGDPGTYAIASTFFSYVTGKEIKVPVEVIPGVTVANAAASLLGSPLGHDFAVISLADLATPWKDTKRRLESAAEADFVIVLYNPKGKAGDQRIKEAIAILMNHRKTTTPVGIVTSASGEDEKVQINTLGELSGSDIETKTIVIIGNSETFVFDERMITPRKYKNGVGY